MAARKKRRRPLVWHAHTQWLAHVFREDRTLVVMVMPTDAGPWGAIAVDTDGDDPAAVLASHGHHVIGNEYESQAAARSAAGSYARSWLSGDVGAPKCECDEILIPAITADL